MRTKSILLSSAIFSTFLLQPFTANAEENTKVPLDQKTNLEQIQNLAPTTMQTLDLSKNESQETTITLKNGQKATIGIRPIDSSENQNKYVNYSNVYHTSKLSNGTFETYWKSPLFQASFSFTVKDGKITKVFDGKYSSMGVVVKSAKLKLDNSKQASYYFELGTPIWDFGGSKGWIRASIEGSKIVYSID